jgi:hypothetical protein
MRCEFDWMLRRGVSVVVRCAAARPLSGSATVLPGVLVQPTWVREAVETRKSDVVFLDSSWHMPAAKRDAAAEFLSVHIPTARFFDIDSCANHAVPYPHMMVRIKSSGLWTRSVHGAVRGL